MGKEVTAFCAPSGSASWLCPDGWALLAELRCLPFCTSGGTRSEITSFPGPGKLWWWLVMALCSQLEDLIEKLTWKPNLGVREPVIWVSGAKSLPGRGTQVQIPRKSRGAWMPGMFAGWQRRCGYSRQAVWVSVQEGLEEGVRSGVCWVKTLWSPQCYFKACGLCSVWYEVIWGLWARGMALSLQLLYWELTIGFGEKPVGSYCKIQEGDRWWLDHRSPWKAEGENVQGTDEAIDPR